jgi:flavin reductase (DIM6/NTAB) family NADH-FMN oxidoreductase RutF
MLLEPSAFPPAGVYHLLTQTVIPRPIAWVMTDNGTGEGVHRYNLAPFSFFNAVSAEPPTLMFAVSHKRDGSKKDTWANVEQRPRCVVHISGVADMGRVIDSSAELPHGVSELARQAYALVPTYEGYPPRIEGAPVAFFCELTSIYPIGAGETVVVFCEIKHIYIEDAAVTVDKGRVRVSPEALQPLARLGDAFYTGLSSPLLKAERPKS